MKLEKRDKERVVLLLEDTEDLWLAGKLIEAHSVVKGRGTRKVQAGEKDVEKKTYTFELDVDQTELQSAGLRVSGTVLNELDDVPKGAHQSILLQAGDRLDLRREWDALSQRRLKQALERVKHDYLVILFDREEAVFLEVSGKGSRELMKLSGEVESKSYDVRSEDFFERLLREAERVAQRGYTGVLFAGSSFWLDDLKKRETSLNARYVPVPSADSSNIRTLLERREVSEELTQLQGVQEMSLVAELLKRVSDGEKFAYGMADVKRAVEFGAAETVMVSQTKIEKAFENDTFEQIRQLLDAAENIQASIEILERDKQAVMQLDSLGGIAALLRFRIG